MGKKQNRITNQNLISEFVKEYNKKSDEFLLFDLANGKENAHTNVLWSILKYGNYMFLPSFLAYLNLPEINLGRPIIVTTQKSAIGVNNGGKGFMDLYIEYYDTNLEPISIILENKVCGASDTKKQLARYIATILKIEGSKFDSWLKGDTGRSDTYDNIYVLYLTLDGTKEPDNESLPGYIKGKVKYIPMNYQEDVLPWIENEVLPHIPYGEDGIMIAGVRQYITSLKKKLSSGLSYDSNVLDDFFKWLKDKNNREKYNCLCGIIDNIKSKKDKLTDMALGQLYKELSNHRKFVFESDAPEEWHLYFTPTFILMYKDSWWSEEDKKKKYNFPSIHLNCNPTNNFINGSGQIVWLAKADRLPLDTKIEDLCSSWKFEGNRNKTISKKIDVEVTPTQENGIKNYFKEIINSNCMKEVVSFLDSAIEEGKENGKGYQDVVLEKVKNRQIQ